MTGKQKVNRKNLKSGDAMKKKSEFTALRRSLFAQFSPTTPLQRIAVEAVVSCSWRCRLATRLDAMSAKQHLGKGTSEAEDETNSEIDSKVRRWYGANRESLRAGIKFLSRCKDDFETNATVRDTWKKDMDWGWGEDFFADLKKWEPAHLVAFQLADHLVKHQQLYGGSLPSTGEREPEVMPDPLLQKQMVSRLLSQEIRHLQAIALLTDQKVCVPRGRLNESSLGYSSADFKSAMNDMQRTVEWFMRLRRHHL